MAHVISINVGKGGCGKTALTVNTAYCLGKKGYRVLVCDNDSQANSTALLYKPNDSDKPLLGMEQGETFITKANAIENPTKSENMELLKKIVLFANYLADMPKQLEMSDVLEEKCKIRDAIHHTEYDNVDILPSSDRLGKTDIELKEKVDPMILRDALEEVYDDYDFILIDNQAFNNSLTINALSACCKSDDMILIPIKIDYGGLEGWASTCVSALNRIRKYRMNCKLRFVVTMKNRNKVENYYTEEILQNVFDKFTFKSVIRFQGAPVARASLNRKLLLENENSKVGEDYERFVDELLSMYCEK